MVKNNHQANTAKKITAANIVCIVLPVLLLVWKRSFLPPLSPLFYSRPWGQEQLAPSYYLFLLPLFSLIVFLINLGLIKFLLPKEESFLALAIKVFSLLFSILNTVTIYKIVFLII